LIVIVTEVEVVAHGFYGLVPLQLFVELDQSLVCLRKRLENPCRINQIVSSSYYGTSFTLISSCPVAAATPQRGSSGAPVCRVPSLSLEELHGRPRRIFRRVPLEL